MDVLEKTFTTLRRADKSLLLPVLSFAQLLPPLHACPVQLTEAHAELFGLSNGNSQMP